MMTTEGNNPSVIAKLMGLDEVPYKQQPIYRQRRVLSEKYLQKSASIGSQKLRSRKSQPIIKGNSTINDSSKDVSFRYIEQKRHSFDGMQGIDSRNSGENGKLGKGIKESDGLIEFTSPAKIVVLKPNLGNFKHASKPSFLLDSHTTFAWEFKKQLLERSKRTKVCQEILSSRQVNLGETPSMADLESKQRSELGTRVVISSNEGWKDKSVTKLPIFKRFNTPSHPNTKLKKMSKGDLKSRSGRLYNNGPAKSADVELSCGDAVIKQITEQIACNDSAKEGCFSCSSDVSSEQLLQDSLCEDGYTSLNCIDIDDELPRSMDEAFQPSPNSVLEPDNSSSSENGDNLSSDLNGLWMKLQILKSESEENQSKPGMVTLSDGDATERPSLCVDFHTKPIRCFGPKQSGEFSYLFNVLNELGFHGGNVEVSFERLHSLEHIVNPLLFETLEKKYGKQESWSKADRRLLFDRINLGLSEILRPHVDIYVCLKPLRRKLSTTLRRDIIEEELWKLLLSQEKEVSANLSKKAIGKEAWLELANEMGSIVEEVEAFLLDELAMELVAI